MTTDTRQRNTPDALTEFWKTRYQRQKLLIASITSLLHKYGNSVDVDHLHSAFLLTLMGHYVTSDACYYRPSPDGAELVPALAYGRFRLEALPVIPIDSNFVADISAEHTPRLTQQLRMGGIGADERFAATFRVAAPLRIKSRLIGLLLLGNRVSGQQYQDFDFDVLHALCAASATTFNNAGLYLNARLSAREIEKLYRLRTEMISRISHEFRTPLTALRGTIELMRTGTMTDAGFDILTESVDRLEALIQSLLQLGDAAPERDDQATSPYDPVAAIQESITTQTPAARAREVHFVLHASASDDIPAPRVRPEHLVFATDALLANAIKFSERGSAVEMTIRGADSNGNDTADGAILPDWRATTRELLDACSRVTSSVDLSATLQSIASVSTFDAGVPVSRYLVVSITDRGIGIPADEISVVAEPFRQASNSPTLGVSGRGLGLALVQKIVAAAGGVVRCRSEVGSGTTMTLYLPAD